MADEYIIQAGDNFYDLAKRFGCSCQDWMQANPLVNPLQLQIGQKVVLPEFKTGLKGKEQYAEIAVDHGKEYSGDHFDEVEMELGGIQFKLKRIGESKIPHEIHLLLPRAEIRKIQPAGENGPCEVQIMLSNVDIVHSPRLMSEGAAKAEKAQRVEYAKTTETTPAAEGTAKEELRFFPQSQNLQQ